MEDADIIYRPCGGEMICQVAERMAEMAVKYHAEVYAEFNGLPLRAQPWGGIHSITERVLEQWSRLRRERELKAEQEAETRKRILESTEGELLYWAEKAAVSLGGVGLSRRGSNLRIAIKEYKNARQLA